MTMKILNSLEKIEQNVEINGALFQCVIKGITFTHEDGSSGIFDSVHFVDCIFVDCTIKGSGKYSQFNQGNRIRAAGHLKFINCRILDMAPVFGKEGTAFTDFFLYMRDTEINDVVSIASDVMNFTVINCDIYSINLHRRILSPYTFSVISSRVESIEFSRSISNFREDTLLFVGSDIELLNFRDDFNFTYLKKQSSTTESLFGKEKPDRVQLNNPYFGECDLRGISFDGVSMDSSIIFYKSKVDGMDFSNIEFNETRTARISFEGCDVDVSSRVIFPENHQVYRAVIDGTETYVAKLN